MGNKFGLLNDYDLAENHNEIWWIGDSFYMGNTTGVNYDAQVPEQFAILARKNGCYLRSRNLGVSGIRADEQRDIIHKRYRFGIPKAVFITLGANDENASASAATILSRLTALVLYLQNCSGESKSQIYAGEANLPANAPQNTKAIVISDTSSTGGLSPTLSGAQTGIRVWQRRNTQAGVKGWGRVTPVNIADSTTWVIPKIIVMGYSYQNFSGGDTVGGTPSRPNTRSAHSSLVTDTGVAYYDLYMALRDLIGVTVTQDDWVSWHCASGNTHPNEQGTKWFAELLYVYVTATYPTWITDWKKPVKNIYANKHMVDAIRNGTGTER